MLTGSTPRLVASAILAFGLLIPIDSAFDGPQTKQVVALPFRTGVLSWSPVPTPFPNGFIGKPAVVEETEQQPTSRPRQEIDGVQLEIKWALR